MNTLEREDGTGGRHAGAFCAKEFGGSGLKMDNG